MSRSRSPWATTSLPNSWFVREGTGRSTGALLVGSARFTRGLLLLLVCFVTPHPSPRNDKGMDQIAGPLSTDARRTCAALGTGQSCRKSRIGVEESDAVEGPF